MFIELTYDFLFKRTSIQTVCLYEITVNITEASNYRVAFYEMWSYLIGGINALKMTFHGEKNLVSKRPNKLFSSAGSHLFSKAFYRQFNES